MNNHSLWLLLHFAGVKLINLMGSHGTKAVAAALMGASVTCMDISPANTQYGQQLAAAAGVEVEFVVSDVLELSEHVHHGAWRCCRARYFEHMARVCARTMQFADRNGWTCSWPAVLLLQGNLVWRQQAWRQYCVTIDSSMSCTAPTPA
jgi:hypothetical protein